MKANKQKHLSKEEHFCIEKMIHAGDSYQTIATGLDRGLSTIKNEVSRNGGQKKYRASKAHRRAYLKQYRKKRDCNKVAMNPPVRTFVEAGLRKEASPEVIAGHLKKHNKGSYVSAKSIRKYVNSRPHLERYLFWERNNKRRGPKRRKSNERLDDGRVFIDERPDTTGVYGHYEGDFIVSKHSKWVLMVIVEKMTKHTMIRLLPHRSNSEVNQAIAEMLTSRTVKSFTFDNDIALKKWRDLEHTIKAPVYFTHPYCSWEKGLVENTNRWIRQYIPKKTDLKTVTDDDIQRCLSWLNDLPRACIDFCIPTYEILRLEGNLLSDYCSDEVSIWG